MRTDFTFFFIPLSSVAHAGQPLIGQIVVKVKRPIEGGNVNLLVTGAESTVIRSKSGNSSQRKIKTEQLLFKVSLPLRTWSSSEKIPKGTYSFPFTVPLPKALPSSTRYPTDKAKYRFRIQYCLLATLEGRSSGKSLKKETIFEVRSAPLPNEKVPRMVEPTSFKLSSMGMFDAGRVTLGANIPDSRVGRGEDLEIHLACRNISRFNIRNVSVTLCETMQWRTCPGGESRTAKRMLGTIKDVDRDSIAKRRASRKSVRKSKKDLRILETSFAEISEDLASGRGKIKVQIPTWSRDSYQGELLEIQHSLQIEIRTSSLTSIPVTSIPIRIGTPPSCSGPRPTVLNAAGAQPAPSSTSSDDSSSLETSHDPYLIQPRLTDPVFLPGERSSDQDLPVPQLPQPRQRQHQVRQYPHHLLQVPIVSAVAVPIDINAAITRAEDNNCGVIHLGRDAIIENDSLVAPSGLGSIDSVEELTNLVPIPPPLQTVDQMEVSVRSLLRQMSLSSINDYDLVNESLLIDARWIRLFSTLSPEQYGLIIGHVKIPANQPRMAVLLADYVNGGRGLTCIYVAAALRKTAQRYRSKTVEQLLLVCVDASTNYALVRQELNEWEQTVAMVRGRNVAPPPANSAPYY
jgi:Arrestin (or S-antigen), N-terminal domain/Arrestin (or S-antigen), C-terminal domain